jgi:hypothetical protein
MDITLFILGALVTAGLGVAASDSLRSDELLTFGYAAFGTIFLAGATAAFGRSMLHRDVI